MTRKEEDWEKCLRWLKHATGDEKFWKYDLDKVQEERELYKLLKDGVLLSRLMRWKKQDSLSDKTINYNTNNISTLEQANIKFFIDDVQKFYKIINIFEKHGPSVFKSYADFYIVLKGLSKLSYKLSPKQYFTVGKKSSEKRVTGEEELNQETDESEYLLYIASNYYEEKTCKTLTQSMEELPRFHKNNLEKVLKVIQEFYVSLKNRSPSNLLITQLLPTLRIKELINIHAEFGTLLYGHRSLLLPNKT
ncbi:uncharacterized protein LOC111713689 [Eurytemora carolleeae]|uniref:uncharacterized protein LOC111713689 n=1 Tax=Eurytemora carolleeae TaxID=1294199 RepID=UPI000C7710C9|nr:uncharacterized protein LOC111713689 [Eurytemora carolleeae]|eukprot:XP_023344393.1 uncharacterized protein LOC111713689 [Eurytemora affinis]